MRHGAARHAPARSSTVKLSSPQPTAGRGWVRSPVAGGRSGRVMVCVVLVLLRRSPVLYHIPNFWGPGTLPTARCAPLGAVRSGPWSGAVGPGLGPGVPRVPLPGPELLQAREVQANPSLTQHGTDASMLVHTLARHSAMRQTDARSQSQSAPKRTSKFQISNKSRSTLECSLECWKCRRHGLVAPSAAGQRHAAQTCATTHWANRPISLPLNHHGPVTPSARGQRLPRAGP